ncbi:MAG: cyclopropane-fatty-acyl-phospholipid synthase [Gammaproteobacteria bacterium RIFCSPHIGHO2_12_FULL_37_14]|nr:MAG: cyclopropane-fatty-acyl-phospholipid synthase [Gammaproteobacteria bacterium RIFCSPHIGHO2_12_FULL_37_14]
MNKITIQRYAQNLLQSAGIHLDGNQPWDIQVHHPAFYQRVINEGALGLGESYMDKWWDCQQLDIFFYKILRAGLDAKVGKPFQTSIKELLAKIINFQSKHRAKDVGKKHYDLGNTLFKAMLDNRMIYSCGYWSNTNYLEEAQLAKLDLICKKLQLKPGLRLLDIGCGWGGLAKYAAEQHGVNVVGVTISQQQYEYAKEYCKGWPIEIRLQDYRDLHDKFDRIVSVGMFEHVGHPNYEIFMQTVHRNLTEEGLFLLHTIGVNITSLFANDWIIKYIFPNGMLPSIAQIAKTSEKFFVMEDWHNFGAYYDQTLMAWYQNFIQHWEELKSKYDERFYRMWTYYLLSCAGTFRARSIQLWQIVLSKTGIVGGYVAPR